MSWLVSRLPAWLFSLAVVMVAFVLMNFWLPGLHPLAILFGWAIGNALVELFYAPQRKIK